MQSRINGTLGQRLHDGVSAAGISFGSGLLVLAVVVLGTPRGRSGLRRLRTALLEGGIRWWQCVGGALGAAFVVVQSVAVPLVGVALYSVAVVAGQTASSAAVDRAGLSPSGRAPVTLPRLVAAALAVVAVLVAGSGGLGRGGHSAVLVASVAAGATLAVQLAVNGHVGRASGQPLVAALVNFAVGGVALALVLAVRALVGAAASGALPGEPQLYLGGVLGIVTIAVGALVVRPLGVLVLGLCSVLGQLTGSLVVDAVVPTPGHELGWRSVAGCAITAVAVVVGSRRGRMGARDGDDPRRQGDRSGDPG